MSLPSSLPPSLPSFLPSYLHHANGIQVQLLRPRYILVLEAAVAFLLAVDGALEGGREGGREGEVSACENEVEGRQGGREGLTTSFLCMGHL